MFLKATVAGGIVLSVNSRKSCRCKKRFLRAQKIFVSLKRLSGVLFPDEFVVLLNQFREMLSDELAERTVVEPEALCQ